MYRLLLCSRYLTTRPIGLVSVVSVMLGVATLIIVNSVMLGFQTQLRSRLHGILSDVMVEAPDLNGFTDLDSTSFNTTCCNSSTASDGKYIFH